MFRNILVLLLTAFSVIFPYAGEVYFIPIETGEYTNHGFSLTVSTGQYTWILENDAVQRIEYAPHTYSKVYNLLLDSPDGINSADQYIPWGIMNFQLTVYTTEFQVIERSWSASFTLDLRDRRWSMGTMYGDQHILIDLKNQKVYLSKNNVIEIGLDWQLNGLVNIWDFWEAGTPQQSVFNVPVTLKNKRESVNESFGYLVKNGININSGSSTDCYMGGQTISHGTTERTDAGVRSYSFKWNPEENTTLNAGSNIYNSFATFQTAILKNSKTFTREFRPVYPLTAKNFLPELGTQSYGTVMFKDPTTTNAFEEKAATGSGFVKNESFADLHITVNNVPEQKYSLQAQQSITYNGKTYNWYQGDFNPNTQTDMLLTGATSKNAYYKGSMITNYSAAFANNSQRKLAKSSDGVLHLVYESLGCIWYETSSDNGATWTLMNGGRPINAPGDNGSAQSPSIDVSTGSAYIVYQLSSPYHLIEFVWFNYTGNALSQRLLVTSSTNEQTIKTNPIIAQNSNSSIYSRLIVAWSSPVSTLGAVDEGVFYRVAKINAQGNWEWTTVDTKIAGTNKYSINPTISYKEIVTPLDFHIAWEESNNIKYTYLRALSDGSATLGAIETPSSGSEFQYNYRPSITVAGNNSVKLAWLSATEPGMDGAISFRSKTGTTWGAFWNFLDTFEPDFVSINKIGASGEFAFVYGLAEYFNYICKNASQTNNLGTHEKYMQLANTPGVSITAVSHLKQGTPITLNVKNISLSTLQKNSGEEDLNTYRGISIFKDTSIISCRIGGIKFGNEDIDFERIDYQDSLKDITKASNYLVTKPFAVSGSSLSFQMKTGFNGSQADIIKENGFIKFKAELIEQSTGAVYALKEIFLNGASSIDEGEMTYNIDLTALKDKTVRLRLTPENNGAAGFAVSNILTPERNPVAKENAVQLSLGESSIPTIYALSQNYPNPFNPSTVISYDIPEASRVTLKVYDILGREVADLVNEFKEAGRYNVKFDASHLSTGIYIYQLRANDYVSVKKMSFVK